MRSTASSRLAVAPQQDRNRIAWYFDAGLAYKGLLPGRDDDMIGLGLAYAQISQSLVELTLAENAFTGAAHPIPSAEAVIEATYQAALTPALSPAALRPIHYPPRRQCRRPGHPGPADPQRDRARRQAFSELLGSRPATPRPDSADSSALRHCAAA